MNTSPRNILIAIAILLTLLGVFLPVPLWIPVLLVEIALFVP